MRRICELSQSECFEGLRCKEAKGSLSVLLGYVSQTLNLECRNFVPVPASDTPVEDYLPRLQGQKYVRQSTTTPSAAAETSLNPTRVHDDVSDSDVEGMWVTPNSRHLRTRNPQVRYKSKPHKGYDDPGDILNS